jgi:hypothetical protein
MVNLICWLHRAWTSWCVTDFDCLLSQRLGLQLPLTRFITNHYARVLTVAHLIQKFFVFCGTLESVPVFTRCRYSSLSRARWIHSALSYPISLRSILIWSYGFCLGPIVVALKLHVVCITLLDTKVPYRGTNTQALHYETIVLYLNTAS